MKKLLLTSLIFTLPALGISAPQPAPLVDKAWVKTHGCQKDVVVLDIRSEKIDGQSLADYRKAHVPCAVHTDYIKAGWRSKQQGVPGMLSPVAKLEKLIGDLGIDGNTQVVISPRGNSAKSMGAASRVYWTFKVLGHDRVSILDGGTQGYSGDGSYSLESGDHANPPKSFKAHLRTDILVSREQVEQGIKDGTALVDYRGPDQFLGLNRHPKVKGYGTLPGAANLPIEWLTVNNSGKLRNAEALQTVYGLANVPADKAHIAFCNTGHNSALGWFAASELMGIKSVRMYDGSMAEWTRQDKPLVTRRVSVAD